mmetsp:Transcript_3614/g.5607  ORF Transcript_3614/g.5607 Transcript_3614/m.5607 type:complete len:93 (-) Transcript_3614:218-496(-)
MISDQRLNAAENSTKILCSFIPFNLFSVLPDSEILDTIKECHRKLDTFKVKSDTVALLKLQNVPLHMRRPGFVIKRQSSSRNYDAIIDTTDI